jgi:hypothetical protein
MVVPFSATNVRGVLAYIGDSKENKQSCEVTNTLLYKYEKHSL